MKFAIYDAGIESRSQSLYVYVYIPRWFLRPESVAHPSTNRARRSATSLIRRTTLPLRQATVQVHTAHEPVHADRSLELNRKRQYWPSYGRDEANAGPSRHPEFLAAERTRLFGNFRHNHMRFSH